MRTKKYSLRLLALLLVAMLMMTSVAFAKSVADVANNVQNEVVAVLSVVAVIGTVFGIVQLVIKRSWLWAILTAIGGFGTAYLISKPEIAMEIVANSLKGIVG